MIIGISGKKQHGKNTFASVMQYLIWKDKAENDPSYKGHLSYTLENFLALDMSAASGWKQVLWAEKLKQVVALMIGCTREKLEDNDFKETPLGEEWRRWYLTHYKAANNANPFGRISELFATHGEVTDYKNNNLFTAGIGQLVTEAAITSELLTPRRLLQLIGTDGGRNMVHPNIWINATLADYKQIWMDSKTPVTLPISTYSEEMQKVIVYPNWIIADTRFPNEAEAIHSKGGLVIRVTRADKAPSGDEHESETALDSYKDFDAEMVRKVSGIDDDYISHVQFILKSLKLLR